MNIVSIIAVIVAIISIIISGVYGYYKWISFKSENPYGEECKIWGFSPNTFLILIICSIIVVLFISFYPYEDSIKIENERNSQQDEQIRILQEKLKNDSIKIEELKDQNKIILNALINKSSPKNGIIRPDKRKHDSTKSTKKDSCKIDVNVYNHK